MDMSMPDASAWGIGDNTRHYQKTTRRLLNGWGSLWNFILASVWALTSSSQMGGSTCRFGRRWAVSKFFRCRGTSQQPFGSFCFHFGFLACHYSAFLLLSVILSGDWLEMSRCPPDLARLHTCSNFKMNAFSCRGSDLNPQWSFLQYLRIVHSMTTKCLGSE